MKTFISLSIVFMLMSSCFSQKKEEEKFEVNETEKEWRERLTPEQFHILRNKGTERAGTGEYYKHFEKGKYLCAGCDNVLFTSDTKYDSNCGWPSFDAAISGAVIYKPDLSYGMVRTEVLCTKCGGHLGHVFEDGPRKTTGKRYCTNSVAIKFVGED